MRRLLLLLALAPALHAYSILTHEAIIDSAWDAGIRPLLLTRFPDANADQLREAHAYAYGGCIIQDMGYYPFGNRLFSDLVHYVRAGDFVVALIRESGSLNEFAFALGALAHYAADRQGHPLGVNPSVPILFPKLGRKFGVTMTYAQDPVAHIRTEFGFDVLQVARGNYAPQSYRDFIGFQVSKPVLERAFADIYGMPLKELFTSLDLALGTWRRAVSVVVPEVTKVAWQIKKDEIIRLAPGMTRRRFLYNLRRSSYEKEWGRQYQRPGPFARVLAVIVRLLPKVGPLRVLSFRPPTEETTRLFMLSFNHTMDDYQGLIRGTRGGQLKLLNLDLDTGQRAHPGEYRLADEAYAQLLGRLADNNFTTVSPELRQDLLDFYANLDAPIATRGNPEKWLRTRAALDKLKAAPPASATF